MDATYVTSLLLALGANSLSSLLGVLALFVLERQAIATARDLIVKRAKRLAGAGKGLLLVGSLAGLVSYVVHANWGHGPSNTTPMNSAELVKNHPSYIVVAALIAAAAALALVVRARIGNRDHIRNAA